MADTFPELGVTASDCIEMMWIQSVLYFAFYGTGKPLEMLLDRGTGKPDKYLKANWLLKDGAGLLILDPYGGEMVRVVPVATPFPHRQALYNIQYYGFWSESRVAAAEKHMGWIRGLYGEMEPYVSKNRRGGATAISRRLPLLETTWSWLLKDGAGLLILDPYGGEMVRVVPVATPFPHRQALYNIQYYGFWSESRVAAAEKHMGWIRGLYGEMEPYVSKNRRGGATAISRRLPLLVRGKMAQGQSCHFEKNLTSFNPEIIK
uniref:Uncharacterized protein n=1 Tax=Oryza meridionalis TaxID=40149 RepID=A0A0E0E432_9ORYZ